MLFVRGCDIIALPEVQLQHRPKCPDAFVSLVCPVPQAFNNPQQVISKRKPWSKNSTLIHQGSLATGIFLEFSPVLVEGRA